MPGALAERFDFFLSRRGSVAAVAQEVADVLAAADYKVFVQDYDIPLGASFVEAMDNAIKNARGLIILFSGDYERSPYTRKEFTSFEAERLQDERDRHIVVLRCEDAPLRGLLADVVYQDLVGVADPEERKRRILAAAERRSSAERPQRRSGRTFVGVPTRIAGFTGRAGELDRLDAILTQKRPAALTQVGRAAVQGMGGVGKSALAVEYANRFRNLYDGVWWCPAETRAGLMTSLAVLAKELGAAAAEEADAEKAAQAALRGLAEQGDIWLLVYDNVASPDAIADLLPAAGARLLITSRFSDWSEWAKEIPLDVLPLAEATAYLIDRAGRSDEAGARALAEALGRLPLALDHAAATCKRTGMSFAAYAAKASGLIAAAPRGAPYPRSVAATFDLAIDEAVKQCRAAEALMAFLAFCAPDHIPLILVEGAIDDESERRAALAALAELSLVKHDPFEDGVPAVTVHRLVQAVARARSERNGAGLIAFVRRLIHAVVPARSDRNGAPRNAITYLITRLAAIYPEDGYNNPTSWPSCTKLSPHLIAVCETETANAARTPLILLNCVDLLNRAGSYFHGRGVYSEARPLLERALAIREKMVGPEDPGTATSLHNLASLLHSQGDLTGARPFYERALAINEKRFGEGLATAISLNNLGGLLHAQGDLAGARTLCARALAIRQNELGPWDPDLAESLHNIAVLIHAQGDLAWARPFYERALSINEKALGPEHPRTATNLRSLAGLLQAQGDLTGARPLYERALSIDEKLLGPQHPDTGESLRRLASLLEAQGDLAGAQPLFERALAIEEKARGPKHPNTAKIRDHLAKLLDRKRESIGKSSP
jgi:tetratricopeptide (TPR) repeat protein